MVHLISKVISKQSNINFTLSLLSLTSRTRGQAHSQWWRAAPRGRWCGCGTSPGPRGAARGCCQATRCPWSPGHPQSSRSQPEEKIWCRNGVWCLTRRDYYFTWWKSGLKSKRTFKRVFKIKFCTEIVFQIRDWNSIICRIFITSSQPIPDDEVFLLRFTTFKSDFLAVPSWLKTRLLLMVTFSRNLWGKLYCMIYKLILLSYS